MTNVSFLLLTDSSSLEEVVRVRLSIRTLLFDWNFVFNVQPLLSLQVEPRDVALKVRTETKVPKTALMLVGWGGNNG